MSSSALRKALPRREHKERHQLESRKHLGLLEKKKDYRLRAKDYHRKQDFLRKLQQKASQKNPDEFYFGMIKARTNKGVHEQDRTKEFDHESQLLMKTQDLNYINTQYQMNAKKLERLQMEQHFIPFQGEHTVFDSAPFENPEIQTTLDVEVSKSVSKERKQYLQELESRRERESKLKLIKDEMQLQKHLMKKGSKRKIGIENGLAVYKWKTQRKR